MVRCDRMSAHSHGKRYLDDTANTAGQLVINDYKRSRITAGATLSFDKPFISEIRANYEKYLYRHDALPKVSERDKIVVEFMTHF